MKRNQTTAELAQSERKRRGMTISGFAALLGVNRNTVAAWEAGWSVPQPESRKRLLAMRRQRVEQKNGFFPVRERERAETTA